MPPSDANPDETGPGSDRTPHGGMPRVSIIDGGQRKASPVTIAAFDDHPTAAAVRRAMRASAARPRTEVDPARPTRRGPSRALRPPAGTHAPAPRRTAPEALHPSDGSRSTKVIPVCSGRERSCSRSPRIQVASGAMSPGAPGACCRTTQAPGPRDHRDVRRARHGGTADPRTRNASPAGQAGGRCHGRFCAAQPSNATACTRSDFRGAAKSRTDLFRKIFSSSQACGIGSAVRR